MRVAFGRRGALSILFIVSLLLSIAAPGGLLPADAAPKGQTCDGLAVTIAGTNSADNIVGTDADDVISGGNGDDVIDGRGGDDVICGDNGKDTLIGGDGDDRLLGGNGKDDLDGGPGTDHVDGGNGKDECRGGEHYVSCETVAATCFGQTITIFGTGGDDELTGTDGDDVIFGDAGNDVIIGGLGNDLICGGDGDDELLGRAGDDQLDGGAGNDVLAGEDGADTVLGGPGDDELYGADGDDTLDGQDGADEVFGGAGIDTVAGGPGDDQVAGGADGDVNDGGAGIDTCIDDSDGNQFIGCETEPEPLTVPTTGLPLSWEDAPYNRDVSVVFGAGSNAAPDDVVLGQDAHRTYSFANKQASPSWNLYLPPENDFTTADLTIRYYPETAPGFDETEMRIYLFDEQFNAWTLVPGPQVVDPDNDTVTVTVEHFSIYAVFALGAAGFQNAWGNIAVTCLPGDSSVGIDVGFLIDTSGSMNSNDPSGLRVDGAAAFVNAMRDQDRAAVVGFSSSASTRIGLTELDTTANINAVIAALEETRPAGGGTNISSAVSRGISLLSSGPAGQARVLVLLTDGQSSYNTALTAQAADEDIVIYTIGLGAGVDAALLQGIADGTGGRYLPLSSASQLVDLYEELSGDLFDDGTDSDGDGLTDCQERNGVPVFNIDRLVEDGNNNLRLITSDPTTRFSDDDLLEDGEEFFKWRITEFPILVDNYGFLLDAGLEFVYSLRAHPTREDADNDGLLDHEEVNGVVGIDGETYRPWANDYDTDDDLISDGDELRIFGSDPFDPRDPIADDPSIAPLDPPGTFIPPGVGEFVGAGEFAIVLQYVSDGVQYTSEIPVPGRIIFYGTDPTRCERSECPEIWRTAEDRIDGWETLCNDLPGGFWNYVLPGGDCDDVAGTAERLTKEYIDRQGLFTNDGRFTEAFASELVANQCYLVAADPDECTNSLIDSVIDGALTVAEIADAVDTILSLIPGGRRPISDDGFEEEQLRKRGLSPNSVLRRPTQADINSQLFRDIVGDARRTPGGQVRGTIFDSVGNNRYWEMKGGSSQLAAGYQIRLQIYFAARDGVPYRLVTSRPLSGPLQTLINQYGSVRAPLC